MQVSNIVLCNEAHLQDNEANTVDLMDKIGQVCSKVASEHLFSFQIQKNYESGDQQESAAYGNLLLNCRMFCNNNILFSTKKKKDFRKQLKLNLRRPYIWGIMESKNSLDGRKNKVGKDIFETQTQSCRNGSVLCFLS